MERFTRDEAAGCGARPRVVVLQSPTSTHVAVLELPAATALGARFLHGCRAWDVVAVREPSRVLFARPATS